MLLPNQRVLQIPPLGYRFGTLSRDISRYCSSWCDEAREIERSHITRPLTRSCRCEPGLMYDLCFCKAWKPQIVDTRTHARPALSCALSIDGNDWSLLDTLMKITSGETVLPARRVDVCRLSPTIDTSDEGGRREIGFISSGMNAARYQERIRVSQYSRVRVYCNPRCYNKTLSLVRIRWSLDRTSRNRMQMESRSRKERMGKEKKE